MGDIRLEMKCIYETDKTIALRKEIRGDSYIHTYIHTYIYSYIQNSFIHTEILTDIHPYRHTCRGINIKFTHVGMKRNIS